MLKWVRGMLLWLFREVGGRGVTERERGEIEEENEGEEEGGRVAVSEVSWGLVPRWSEFGKYWN